MWSYEKSKRFSKYSAKRLYSPYESIHCTVKCVANLLDYHSTILLTHLYEGGTVHPNPKPANTSFWAVESNLCRTTWHVGVFIEDFHYKYPEICLVSKLTCQVRFFSLQPLFIAPACAVIMYSMESDPFRECTLISREKRSPRELLSIHQNLPSTSVSFLCK